MESYNAVINNNLNEVKNFLIKENKTDIYYYVNNIFFPKCTALHMACYYENLEILKLLINDKRININKETGDNYTILHIACLKGNVEIIKFLLKNNKLDLNKKNYYGFTSLHYACMYNRINIIKIFFASGRYIDLNIKDAFQRTILNIAELNNFNDIIQCINNYKNNKEEYIEKLKKELFLNFFLTNQEKLFFFCADGEILNIKKIIYKKINKKF